MKRHILLTLILFTFAGAFAQNISVADFQRRESDMTAASLEGRRKDQNGEWAALIRIETTETGFVFEGGALGIVDSKQETGEVWVWVPRASRKITIKHPKLGVLYDYRYPIEIEAERTYWMKLITGKVITTIEEEGRQQYLIFELEPKNATLEVDDKLWSVDADGTALQFVDFGTYTYRVRAANYITDAGVVTVDDLDNPKTIKVKLKPDFAEVTLKVDADAEIWVNNEKKGTRTWTGPLGKGTYKIECKQEGHEPSMISKEITSEMNGQTITLPAPTPIYGSLNVESTPIGATIFIDGKEVGKTPKSINEILVGEHEIRLFKEDFKDYSETITITKGNRMRVIAKMITSYPEGAIKGLFSVGKDKKVYFSKGNLQYQASTNTWRFATNQWDFVGGTNNNPSSPNYGTHLGSVSESSNNGISSSYSGWIDLFGWGTGDNPSLCTENEKDYEHYEDWGNNKISNGGEEKWRTLSPAEWEYVVHKRNTISGIRFAKAKVNGIAGLILLPDDWNQSNFMLENTDDDVAGYDNTISSTQWNILEHMGVVFLPAAGTRVGIVVQEVGIDGCYWSALYGDGSEVYGLSFDEAEDFFDCGLCTGYTLIRKFGHSVRLVCPEQ